MRCHQILTGAANKGENSFGIGSVEGIPFTAYGAGCNVVILASTFDRVQIIPGVGHSEVQIQCLAASEDTGKIAAAYGNIILIFEPTPLLEQNSNHGLDYWWVETARLESPHPILAIDWNSDGNQLITGGELIQLWQHKIHGPQDKRGVSFQLGHDKDGDEGAKANDDEEETASWTCIWKTRPPNEIVHLAFSPDGTLFATAGKHDRLVRVWFQNNQMSLLSVQNQDKLKSAMSSDNISFSYIYLTHPRGITKLSWRKTSKYMPKAAVSNMLVTSCLDNICRIWCETILPEDGVINMSQLDPTATKNSKFRIHRQKARFIQRFKHMRQSFSARKLAKGNSDGRPDPISTLPSTYSVHDFHNYGFRTSGVAQGLHFHLASTINAKTDIPLVPAMATEGGSKKAKHNFVLHWLNNKEVHFTLEAEKIMEEVFRIATEKEDAGLDLDIDESNSGSGDSESGQNKQTAARPPPPPMTPNAAPMPLSKARPGVPPRAPPRPPSNSSITAQSDISQPGSGHHGSVGSGGSSIHNTNVNDMLDHRIDKIIKEWHQNSDLLFSIHPVDGSLLVWVADFLDEYMPGSFRQAQVSFSSRIPNALPLGDAMSMSSSVALFNASNFLNLKELFRSVEANSNDDNEKENKDDDDDNNNNSYSTKEGKHKDKDDPENGDENETSAQDEQNKKESTKDKEHRKSKKYKPPPMLSMISKHRNGTLNLWNVMFAERSKFSQLLNIAHSARVSGHRFRVNGITAHPVLPLVLTTSHHNILHEDENEDQENEVFCSELILWRVDPVGPLSKSGGISELARINSKEISAFSDVAWIPTLLPSTTLGSVCNSPSACFVASDGKCLRVYQAVIDARTLLAEINSASARKSRRLSDSMMSLSSGHSSPINNRGRQQGSGPAHAEQTDIAEKFKVVSTQSTARPGAIIELETIKGATQNWQDTILLHAFQEQLILAQCQSDASNQVKDAGDALISSSMGAMVDLQQQTAGFSEPFYSLVAQKTQGNGVMMHMWRLVVSSHTEQIEDDNITSGSITPDPDQILQAQQKLQQILSQSSEVHVTSEKVCTERLPLPDSVEVIDAVPAVGHLSSASIYPACLAPYVMVTACSDNTIRFWRLVSHDKPESKDQLFSWKEWVMESQNGHSSIVLPGRPVSVSSAYSGRIAAAYQTGHTFTKPHSADPKLRYVNLCVAIYECESTGGSEWVLEDTISLKNIEVLPEIPDLDLTVYGDDGTAKRHAKQEHFSKFALNLGNHGEDQLKRKLKGLISVPSLSTFDGVKRYISQVGNNFPGVTPKQSVMLDWVSKEDGSHILTVAVGNKVLLLTAVSSDISQASMKALKESRVAPAPNRPLIRKSSSMGFQQYPDEIRWMQIRRIALKTADGLNPTPMSISWVRDGLLMCGMDNEIAVFSQWRQTDDVAGEQDIVEHRNLGETDIRNLVQESQMRGARSHATLSSALSKDGVKKKGTDLNEDFEMMADFGLFEAAHITFPVLPQYHPKQLMELLNSGKIRWVKAILGHLIRCIGGVGMDSSGRKKSGSFTDDGSRSPRGWSRSRTLSISYQSGQGGGVSSQGPLSPGGPDRQSSFTALPEEITLDYEEITSVPPLPLWTLLAADRETGGTGMNSGQEGTSGYDDLFQSQIGSTDDTLESILEEDDDDDELMMDGDEKRARRKSHSVSGEKTGLSYFGPRQSRMLSKLLTHTQLPGLTSLDQMHLLALADTVASCQLDLAERFAIDAAKRQMAKESLNTSANEPSLESLDDCGLRFLLAMKHFFYLQRCLPINQRKALLAQGLSTSNLIWGFHSESEDELLQMIPSIARGKPNWQELKDIGLGWWLRSNTLLKRVFEKLAKTAFQANQDPLDAAIFYLAMKKKSLVWGLFRSIKDERMTQFFSNDFSHERWKKAALKNAFALLGKQRFMHAAAFFLLSGSLKDAIDVCIDKLNDLQLGMAIARLYDGDINPTPNSLISLLNVHILGRDINGENENLDIAHPDPFLRSIALWINKEYSQSLATLVNPNIGHLNPNFTKDEALALAKRKEDTDPSVFNFYIYLRTHPLIARHQIAQKEDLESARAIHLSGFRSKKQDKDSTYAEDAVTLLERRLYFSTAHFHLRGGCPALAVEVLSKLPSKVITSSTLIQGAMENESVDKSNRKLNWRKSSVATGTFDDSGDIDWSKPLLSPKVENIKEEKNEEEKEETEEAFDWGAPISKKITEDTLDLDWSQPVAANQEDELKLEWSDDPDTDDSDLDSKDKKKKTNFDLDLGNQDTNNDEMEKSVVDQKDEGVVDIMAQQLKFIACLQIMMEELSTLATGFEVDGGLLRYQLYIWLEREVDALKQLCHYGVMYHRDLDSDNEEEKSELVQSTMRELFAAKGRTPTLHEVMMAERADFQAKINRAMRRKRWLKDNQTLLRTLLSYCSLHGSNGGGLALVRMELILLLQELQQEKTHKQLLSPLPFPTTLPLLSAVIAQHKTVVTDPVRHLQASAHDMLGTMVNLEQPPFPGFADYSAIFKLRDLSVALSSCIYQSLCDSDSINMKKIASREGPNRAILEALSRLSVAYQDSSLINTSSNRKMSFDETTTEIFTEPSKWPGVTSLRALLDREKDDESPNLNVLLCETFVAIYLSLLSFALASCDAQILYRLVSQKIDVKYWSSVFGGGAKKMLQITHSPLIKESSAEGYPSGQEGSESESGSLLNTVTSITKKRMQLNMKILGVQLGSSMDEKLGGTGGQGASGQEKQSYREHFVPPEKSVIAKLMSKPLLESKDLEIDFDSGTESDEDIDNVDDEDDEDPFSNKPPKPENREASNPNSYAWCLIRYACIRLAQLNLEKFITLAGIELPAPLWQSDSWGRNACVRKEDTFEELPVASPLIYASLRVTEAWIDASLCCLDAFGSAPENFIPGCFANSAAHGPAILKYKSLFELQNTPFPPKGHHGVSAIKRLWQFLVRQPQVQTAFIKYIFGRRKLPSTRIPESQSYGSRLSSEIRPVAESEDHQSASWQIARMHQPVKIIHKEHESISAFCINKKKSGDSDVSTGLMSVATPKELQELNISLLLNPSSWNEGMNDEAEFDVLNLNEDPESLPSSNYLVIQTPGDNIANPGIPPGGTSGMQSPAQQVPPFGPSGGIGQQQPKGVPSTVVKRYKVDGIRRLASHTHLPLYLTGCQDGSIRMWEWLHGQTVQNVRPPGVFGKVNRIRFTAQGNKFGACDGDGTVALWQSANAIKPYFSIKCHSKQTSDFVFLGACSSLFCSAGHSTDGKNIALWDTLLPQKRSQVQAFSFHDSGASALVHAPQRMQIISAGKKGVVAVWDVRRQQQVNFFKAHDQAIKCLALDPNEEFFVTGSAAGDIKIWSMNSYKCCYTFNDEHVRHGIFKNISQGVSHVYVDQQNRLFSCGADGSLKVRQLPDRDLIVTSG